MELFLFFVLGLITIRYIFPLLDQILAWILTAIEVRKGALLVKQTQYEKEISDITILMDKPTTNAIGFCVSDYSEEEEEEDV